MSNPTRRDCLRAAAVALTVPGRSVAAPAKSLPLGFSLYAMKTLPVADALAACAKIGYAGVEFALMPGWPTEPKKLSGTDRTELRKRTADHGLAVHGLMENLPATGTEAAFRPTLDRLKAAFALAHDLNPTAPPPVETILGGKPADWDAVKDTLAERMTKWADAAASAKVVVAVKPHVANALHTVEAAKWLIGRVNSPWLRLAFDSSHFQLRGVAPETAAAELGPLSAFAHVKDAKGAPDKFEFLLPGDAGTTNYPALAGALAKSGYAGPVVVEVSALLFNRPGFDPVAAAKRCHANLAPAFGG